MGSAAACSRLQEKEGDAGRSGRRRRKEGETLMYLGFYGDLTASCLVIKDAESDGDEHPVGSDTQLDQTPCQKRHPIRTDTPSEQTPCWIRHPGSSDTLLDKTHCWNKHPVGTDNLSEEILCRNRQPVGTK